MSEQKHGLSTRCVHAGDRRDPHGAIHTPLYHHSTFAFPNTQAVLDVVEKRVSGNLYTRYGLNPTILSTEEKLASIEGAERAWLFGSGMAAISATLLTLCGQGDHILCIGDIYGGTHELMQDQLPTLGIETTFLLGTQLAELEAQIRPTTRLIYFETPTNPTLEIFDIEAIARIAHAHHALLVVDNTFATPVNQRPLDLGADLVIHSATKYLGGHSDLTAGAVLGSGAPIQAIWNWRKNLGQVLGPEAASLLARSLRTLSVRVRAHNEGALILAERLEAHPSVARVYHPGLPSHPQHALAQRQMSGFGGMLSFVVRGGAQAAAATVDRLQLFSNAPSLGGVESLVSQPIITTHHHMGPAERARRGIEDGLIRLSVGLETPEDLWADLAQALSGASSAL